MTDAEVKAVTLAILARLGVKSIAPAANGNGKHVGPAASTFADNGKPLFHAAYGFTADDAGNFAHYFSEDDDGHYPGNMHRYFGMSAKEFADHVHKKGGHLQVKVITVHPKEGKPYQRKVWVNPNKGEQDAERKKKSEAFKSEHEGRTPKEHLIHQKAQEEPKREVARAAYEKAQTDPHSLTAADLIALKGHLQTLTRDELREHAKKVREKVGGLKVELADRLLAKVRELKARGQLKTTGQYGSWGRAVAGTEPKEVPKAAAGTGPTDDEIGDMRDVARKEANDTSLRRSKLQASRDRLKKKIDVIEKQIADSKDAYRRAAELGFEGEVKRWGDEYQKATAEMSKVSDRWTELGDEIEKTPDNSAHHASELLARRLADKYPEHYEVGQKLAPDGQSSYAVPQRKTTPTAEPAKKPKPAAKKKRKLADTVIAKVIDLGGIDPTSHDLFANYRNIGHALEDGIPLSVFRRGGRSLDQVAREMESMGYVNIPPGKQGGEHILDLIRDRAHTLAADLSKQHEKDLDEYYKAEEHAKRTSTDAGIAEAVRSGEAAGRDEAEKDPVGSHGEGDDADDTREHEGGDTSFDPEGWDVKTPDPADNATTDHKGPLAAVPAGDTAYVAGHLVRRMADGRYQIEHKGKYVVGDAAETDARIRQTWKNQEHERTKISAALDRSKDAEDPDPFADPKAAADVARRRAMVPDGTRAVSLDDATRGRTGAVVRDPDTGAASLVLDGGREAKATDFEPLNERHSWRVPEKEPEKETSLFRDGT